MGITQDDPMEYIDLEMEYYASLKNLPKTDMEWLEIFPEAKPLVKKNIKDELVWWKSIEHEGFKDLQNIKNSYVSTPPTKHAELDWYKETIEKRISKAHLEIRKLQWQQDKLSGVVRPSTNGIDDGDKELARTIPISNFVQTKRMGNKQVTICIFHNDTKPSLVIFPDNRFKCFACNAFGDSIDFIKKLQGLEFIDAVKFLLNK